MVYYAVKNNRNAVLHIFLVIILACFTTEPPAAEKNHMRPSRVK